MSSLFETAMHSDAGAPTPSSDIGNVLQTSQRMRSSSARPRAPPSESNAAHSDIEQFPDDEVVGARPAGRRPATARGDVPKVVDVTGETLSQRFEEFLEG